MFRLALWEPYGIPLVRWMAFLPIQGYILQFSVTFYFASRRPSSRPLHSSFPPSLCCFLTNIKRALSQLWLWLLLRGKSGGRLHDHSWLDTEKWRLRFVSESHTYGSYFWALLMNRTLAQRSCCVGAEEDCWLSKKTFQAFLCLSDAARRSAFRRPRLKEGRGTETLG